MKKYDYIIYIGRFQPLHNAHVETIKYAAKHTDNIIVLIGSSRSPRTIKNPFTYTERKKLISNVFPYGDTKVRCAPIRDYPYNDVKWIEEVGNQIALHTNQSKKVAIIGHDKDHTSFYLNYFPQYDYIEVPAYPPAGKTIDATTIRQFMFDGLYGIIEGIVPSQVFHFIMNSRDNSWFKLLVKEYEFNVRYKNRWSSSPYPPQFVTVDAVVVQSGHILLIRRKNHPGKDLWALPGGFVGEKETLASAVVRELKEETKLKVPKKILERLVENSPMEVFDDPDRSLRGRTFTNAYLIKLNDNEPLPRVKGADDAAEAKWVPLSEFESMDNVFFEDHHAIASKMIQFIN